MKSGTVTAYAVALVKPADGWKSKDVQAEPPEYEIAEVQAEGFSAAGAAGYRESFNTLEVESANPCGLWAVVIPFSVDVEDLRLPRKKCGAVMGRF